VTPRRAYTGAVSSSFFVRTARLAVLVGLMACGGDDSDKSPGGGTDLGDGDGDAPVCQDADGDGYGLNCDAGEDCDDADDTVFENCGACDEPREGCACEAAATPVDCKVPADQVQGDPLFCKVGKRYCRDGAWSACIGIIQFAE
jgi:hypothetical protein